MLVKSFTYTKKDERFLQFLFLFDDRIYFSGDGYDRKYFIEFDLNGNVIKDSKWQEFMEKFELLKGKSSYYYKRTIHVFFKGFLVGFGIFDRNFLDGRYSRNQHYIITAFTRMLQGPPYCYFEAFSINYENFLQKREMWLDNPSGFYDWFMRGCVNYFIHDSINKIRLKKYTPILSCDSEKTQIGSLVRCEKLMNCISVYYTSSIMDKISYEISKIFLHDLKLFVEQIMAFKHEAEDFPFSRYFAYRMLTNKNPQFKQFNFRIVENFEKDLQKFVEKTREKSNQVLASLPHSSLLKGCDNLRYSRKRNIVYPKIIERNPLQIKSILHERM